MAFIVTRWLTLFGITKTCYFVTFQLEKVTPIICKLTAANQNAGVCMRAVERHHSYYN